MATEKSFDYVNKSGLVEALYNVKNEIDIEIKEKAKDAYYSKGYYCHYHDMMYGDALFNISEEDYIKLTHYDLPVTITETSGDGSIRVITVDESNFNENTRDITIDAELEVVINQKDFRLNTVTIYEAIPHEDTVRYWGFAYKDEIPTKLSQLTDDDRHRLVTDTEKSNWNQRDEFENSEDIIWESEESPAPWGEKGNIIYTASLSDGVKEKINKIENNDYATEDWVLENAKDAYVSREYSYYLKVGLAPPVTLIISYEDWQKLINQELPVSMTSGKNVIELNSSNVNYENETITYNTIPIPFRSFEEKSVTLIDAIPTKLSQLASDSNHQTISEAEYDWFASKLDKVSNTGDVIATTTSGSSYINRTSKLDIKSDIKNDIAAGVEAKSMAQDALDAIANIVIPTELSQLNSDDEHLLVTKDEKDIWDNKSDFDGSYYSLDDQPKLSGIEADESALHISVANAKRWNSKDYYMGSDTIERDEIQAGGVDFIDGFDVSGTEKVYSFGIKDGSVSERYLSDSVKESLGKADTALQTHQDISGKQDKITSSNKLSYGLISGTPTSLPANGGTATNVSGTVAVANGGTGATTASNARINLGLGDASTKSIKTLSAAGASGWTNLTDAQKLVPDMGFIAYWNGAYSGTSSNLAYCNQGAFAKGATKSVDTSISASSTSANIPTSAAVASFVEGKGYKTTDNNTTYTFATGDSNGQIKVTPSGGSAQNITVKGLGSLAYSSAKIPTKTSDLNVTYLTTTVNSSDTATFTNAKITNTCLIDIYTDNPNLHYESREQNGTTFTVKFPEILTNTKVTIKIEEV